MRFIFVELILILIGPRHFPFQKVQNHVAQRLQIVFSGHLQS